MGICRKAISRKNTQRMNHHVPFQDFCANSEVFWRTNIEAEIEDLGDPWPSRSSRSWTSFLHKFIFTSRTLSSFSGGSGVGSTGVLASMCFFGTFVSSLTPRSSSEAGTFGRSGAGEGVDSGEPPGTIESSTQSMKTMKTTTTAKTKKTKAKFLFNHCLGPKMTLYWDLHRFLSHFFLAAVWLGT